MVELKEDQFHFLKGMCDAHAFIALAPLPTEKDSKDLKVKYEKQAEELRILTREGFMEDVTDKFEEILVIAKEQGERLFEAYVLTEQTVLMFMPPEGKIN